MMLSNKYVKSQIEANYVKFPNKSPNRFDTQLADKFGGYSRVNLNVRYGEAEPDHY